MPVSLRFAGAAWPHLWLRHWSQHGASPAGPRTDLADNVGFGSAAMTWLALGLLAAVVVAVGIGVIARYAARRTRRGRDPMPSAHPWHDAGFAAALGVAREVRVAALPLVELRSQVDQALLATDDAVRNGTEQLGFAEAQVGVPALAGFREALAAARAELADGFGVRLELDDHPDPTRERAAALRILAHCRRAIDRLESVSGPFARVRDLEDSVQDVLVGTSARASELSARLATEAARVHKLSGRYAWHVVIVVSTNVDQAADLLAYVERLVGQAWQQIALGRRAAAVEHARTVEEAVGQAGVLLDAIGRLEADLEDVTVRLAPLRAELAADLSEVRPLAVSGRLRELGSAVAETEAVLADTRPSDGDVGIGSEVGLDVASGSGVEGGGSADPLGRLRRLIGAADALDRGLGPVRDARERAVRAGRLVDLALRCTRAEIATTRAFVATRRGAIGVLARTRLAAAITAYDRALATVTTDPVLAFRYARTADVAALRAGALARSDVAAWCGAGAPHASGYGAARTGPTDATDPAASGRVVPPGPVVAAASTASAVETAQLGSGGPPTPRVSGSSGAAPGDTGGPGDSAGDIAPAVRIALGGFGTALGPIGTANGSIEVPRPRGLGRTHRIDHRRGRHRGL